MYKFQEWYMQQSTNGVQSIGMLARLEDFAIERNKVVWQEFRDIYEVYHLDALNTNCETLVPMGPHRPGS
jgi:hypothetical protein